MKAQSEPPQDIAAEQAVLGGMLLSRDAIADVVEVVGADAFHKPAHELIFAAVLELYSRGEPADAVTVGAELAERGELSRIGGAPYLLTLMSSVPIAASAGYYAQIVRDRAIRRRGMSEAHRLYLALDPAETSPDDLCEVFAARLEALAAVLPAERRVQDRGPHLADIPAYPVDVIPGPLGVLVQAGIQRGLDPALVGGAGLGALSSIAGGARLEVRPGQKHESAALWLPLGGDPGTGKSPAMNMAFSPIYDLEQKAYEQYEDELEVWESTPARERGPRPVALCRINDDVTLEAVARWLKTTGGHGGLVPDELTGWIGSIGRYRTGGADGGERARHLTLWDGAPWKFERVTQGINIRIHNPALAVCGGIQPDNYPLLGPESDGMRPRWLPHLARVGVSEWRGAGDVTAWHQAVEALYAAITPRLWHTSPQALKALDSATARWREHARDSSSNPSVTAAARKGDRQAMRIALALAESMNPGADGDQVAVEEMEAAIAIVDYALGCWAAMPSRAVLTLSQREERLSGGVDQLAAWLEAHGGSADKRTLQLAKVAGARTAGVLNALLVEYEAVYPGSVTQERINKSGPATTMVYAPRRGRGADRASVDPPTVDGNSSRQSDSTQKLRKSPGHATVDAHATTADAVSSSPVNGSASTVSESPARKGGATRGAVGSAPGGWPANESGSCAECGTLTHKFGEGGNPLCPDCRAKVLKSGGAHD